MNTRNLHISEQIRADLVGLARAVVDQQYKWQPVLRERYGAAGYEKCVQDTQAHLAYLAEAVAASDVPLFVDYVHWASQMLQAFHVQADDFAANLQAARVVIAARFATDDLLIVSEFIDAGLSEISNQSDAQSSYLDRDAPLAELANTYLAALLNGDRKTAIDLIMGAVGSGVEVRSIYLYVFQPVQYELGRLWQTNVISVAHEHFCTAATQHIMARLYPYIASAPRNGHRMVAACTSGELHDIGMRMVADFFEMGGWDTFYLGANMPLRGLLSTLSERKPEVLALSATITSHLDKLREIIQAVRARDEFAPVRIIVGGYPFNVAPRLWREIGADGYARDCDSAVRTAESLIGSTV